MVDSLTLQPRLAKQDAPPRLINTDTTATHSVFFGTLSESSFIVTSFYTPFCPYQQMPVIPHHQYLVCVWLNLTHAQKTKHLAVFALTLPFRTVSLRDWASVQTLLAFIKILRPFVGQGSQSQLSQSDKKPSPVVCHPTRLSTLKTCLRISCSSHLIN